MMPQCQITHDQKGQGGGDDLHVQDHQADRKDQEQQNGDTAQAQQAQDLARLFLE